MYRKENEEVKILAGIWMVWPVGMNPRNHNFLHSNYYTLYKRCIITVTPFISVNSAQASGGPQSPYLTMLEFLLNQHE